MENIEEQIKNVIHKLRPYLQRDGGDIEYVDFKDGIVYVRMLGACAGCTMIDETLKDGVEQILMEEVPGVLEVQNISSVARQLGISVPTVFRRLKDISFPKPKILAIIFEIVNREIMDTKPALIFYFDFAMPKST